MFAIAPHRKIWYAISGTLTAAAIVALVGWGLRLGIDFTGGSLLQLTFPAQPPTVGDLRQTVQAATKFTAVTVQSAGVNGMIVRFPQITEVAHQQLWRDLTAAYPDVMEERFDAIGPTIGKELRVKTMWAIGLAVVGMILYISIAFRKVMRPLPSWLYGAVSIVALLHNMLITTGVFVALGKLYGLEVGAPFVAAMLTVFGYSVNDTIVVFDRVRDNLMHHPNSNFLQLVEASIQQTFRRSTNTGMCVLLSLLAILAFGGETIRDFALALIIGIAFGTYTSIFLASPLLIDAQRLRQKRIRQ